MNAPSAGGPPPFELDTWSVTDPEPVPTFPHAWLGSATVDLSARPIVKGLIEEASFNVVYGASGSGKSFFTADLCQHVAQGVHWRDKKTRAGLIVYVASEAGSSILKRFVGWRNRALGDAADLSPAALPLAILTRGPNILEAREIAGLAEQIMQLEQECGLPCVLVVFDTLSRSMPGGDENSTKDMTRAVNAGDYLRAKFKCATIYVHHTGKDAEKGMRGNSSLFAACDLVIQVTKIGEGAEAQHQAMVEKVRDGVAGDKFGFTLKRVELGLDYDGDAVHTCVVEQSDYVAPQKSKKPIGGNQKMLIESLTTLSAEEGEKLPPTSAIPPGRKGVSYERLVQHMLPQMPPDMKAYTARQRIQVAALSLKNGGFIGIQGDWVWLS